MTDIRLLALDMDGTTLTNDNDIADETKKWIHKAARAGVTVMFATGRGLENVEPYRRDLRLESPMVLVNGGEVWKSPGYLLKRFYLDNEDIQNLQRIASESGAWYWGYLEDRIVRKNDWRDEFLNRRWIKFGIQLDDIGTLREITEEIKSWGRIEVTSSAANNIELSSKGVSKESGVRLVCKELGIQMRDVMAIGDSDNDYCLLKAAGLGVAMGNANDRIKAIADVSTDTNERSGVAKAIQRYIFGMV